MTRNVSWLNLSRNDRTFSGPEEPWSYRRLRLGSRFAIISSRYQYSPFLFLVADVLSNYLTTYALKKFSNTRGPPEAWSLRTVAFATSATWLIRHWATCFAKMLGQDTKIIGGFLGAAGMTITTTDNIRHFVRSCIKCEPALIRALNREVGTQHVPLSFIFWSHWRTLKKHRGKTSEWQLCVIRTVEQKGLM